MTKTHLTNGCGRGQSTTSDVSRVTCLNCQATPAYATAKADHDAERARAFMAQTPRQFREPWNTGNIVCKSCGNDRFRMGDRTCYGHYENYVCSACGGTESRLTETGMAF